MIPGFLASSPIRASAGGRQLQPYEVNSSTTTGCASAPADTTRPSKASHVLTTLLTNPIPMFPCRPLNARCRHGVAYCCRLRWLATPPGCRRPRWLALQLLWEASVGALMLPSEPRWFALQLMWEASVGALMLPSEASVACVAGSVLSPPGTALARRASRSWAHVHDVRCYENTSLSFSKLPGDDRTLPTPPKRHRRLRA